MPRAAFPLALLALLAGCVSAPDDQFSDAPRPVKTLAQFSVSADGRAVGTLKKLAIEDPRGRVLMWRVENSDRQYLGFADAEGRFYRHLPFEERETFVGIYPMEAGLQVLFETRAAITTKAIEADFKKDER